MRWWDDLWLNESFAEYLGVRVTAESTRFDRAWTTFGLRRKASGYVADQRPSTHPVAPAEVADAAHALLNFDGISYAKGASVLRQLVASLGDEAFFAGLRAHFAAHRFGNATLADLLAALAEASGRDLGGWADVWLRRAGVDTLRTEVTTVDGRYQSVHIVQTGAQRPHRVGFGVYDGGTLRQVVPVDVVGERTEVAELAGEPMADLLLVNAGDLTFAKVRLDAASAAGVMGILPALDDSLDRAVLWSTVIDSVRDGDSAPADLVALVVTALPLETEPVVVEGVLGMTGDLVDRYLEPVPREIALQPMAMACDRLLASAPPGGSLQLAAARGLIGASTDARRLAGWLKGKGVPEGLRVDTDLRWALCYRMVVLGAAGPDKIDAELATDRSATGEQWAARCRAALPDASAKERAWRVITADTTLSNRLVEAHAEGFWQPEQADLTQSYVERYFAEMPAAARMRTPWVADQVAKSAYPRYAVAASTRKAAAVLLARDDLEPGLRRVVIDADDDLRRALAARG
jgi:aminopeptidase N